MVERSLSNPSIPYSSNDTRPMYCGSKGGCIGQLRLGGTFKSRSVLPGPVERQRLHCPHKQERDHGRSQDSSASNASGGLCPVRVGQHDSCVLHKPDGGDPVKAPVFGSNVSLGDGSLQGRLAAVWVPREENQLSDLLSKSALQTWDFSLDKDVAASLWTRWFLPTVDTFASKACHLLPQYYSWHPDQSSQARDALSVQCWPDRVYCFPPVPMISLVLQKIQSDRVTAIIIVPGWKSALWWDMLTRMLLEEPVHLPYYTSILSYSNPLTQQRLPYLHPLVACLVSGAVHSLS